ncbi:hypothetical protein ACFL21_04830 [Patescibacteria group bacterium]
MAQTIKEENPPLIVAPIKIHASSDNYKKNEHIYKGIGDCIKEGYGVHTACDHGAHRAIISMMCGWMESGKVGSLGQAYTLAGGKIDKFQRPDAEANHEYRSFFRQAVHLAKDKGIHVEPIFVDFVTNDSFRVTHEQVLSQIKY